jgi:NADPH:quinone reductase
VRGIQLTRFGGPELLQVSELPDPEPGPGEDVFDVLASGINYADTHQTEDTYLARQVLPLIPGAEVVVRGADGGRLLGLVGSGGYATRIAADPRGLVPVPDGVSDGAALAALVQGTTALYLLRHSVHLQEGESVVIHAAAGGVGTQAVQLARRLGAGRVIATTSTEPKRALARELGADVAVDSTVEDLVGALRQANDGRRIDVVLEMTGGRVFDQSLAALAPFGRLAVFGLAGRTPPTPIEPAALMARSVAVVGFWLAHVVQRPTLFAAILGEVLELMAAGELRAVVGASYPLEQAADAHRALLDRSSAGKLILQMTDLIADQSGGVTREEAAG